MDDECVESVELVKKFSMLFKEVGQDMLNISKMTDEYLRLATDPLEIIFNRDLPEELDELMNKIQVNTLMVMNKLDVLAEFSGEGEEKGEESNE